MNWFYAIGDQQFGPVSDAQLDELVASGKINRDTLVWREGLAEWQPLGNVRSGGTPPIPALPPVVGSQTLACAECGRSFPIGDMIQLNRTWICAQCKPIFLQKLQEGVASPRFVGNIWRKGKQLVTISETPFPDRCVKCNAPANGYRLKRVLYWQHPAYYLLLLCNLLILIIVVLAVRKKAVLHIGLCAKHQAARKQALLIGRLGAIVGVIVGLAAFALPPNFIVPICISGFLVALGFLIYLGVKGPMVSPAKITKENVWLNGVSRDFLADLPEWPGS
jgi:GYF domain 2